MENTENVSQEEIADLMSTDCTMAVVFTGKLRNLYEVAKFLKGIGCYVYYKKSAKGRLNIVVQKEKGEANGNSK